MRASLGAFLKRNQGEHEKCERNINGHKEDSKEAYSGQRPEKQRSLWGMIFKLI